MDIETFKDVNDNPPAFPTTAILLTVKENLPRNTKVKRIAASDPDLGDSGKIEYAIRGTDDFRIDPDSGDIYTTLRLDREAKDSYSITVIATDKGEPLPQFLSGDGFFSTPFCLYFRHTSAFR